MLVHRMVKKVKDSKVWAKINTKDGGPGSGIKGHTTAEEPTQARPAAKAEEPKGGEGRSFASKEHAQAYINGAAKTASKLLGAGVKQGYTGFEWSKKGGYADVKMKLTRMKIEKAGFKEVDFDQADHPAGNWTRNTTIFQNENGDVIKMTSRYGETSRQNSHSVAYTPKDFNKAKERLYAQDSDHRGYKVSDQIIKGFLIYKSGKGPATFFAKNENGKEFEGTMEQIKKQIDDYWVKQDESVMKQKVRDEKIPYVKSGTTRGYIIEVENDKNEVFPWKGYIVTQKGKYYICKEKTKQEAINECKKYIESRESEIRDSKKVRDGESKKELEEYIKMLEWDLASEDDPEEIKNYKNKIEKAKQKLKTADSKTKDVGGFIGVATTKAGKYFTGYKKQEKSPRFDTEEKANEWCRFRMQRSDAKYIAKCEVVPTNDSKTKDASQAYLDGYAAARGAYGKHTNPVKDDPAKAAEWDKGWEDGKADKDELSAKGSGQEFVKHGSHFKDAKPKHPRWRIKDDKLFRLRSAIKKVKRVKDVELSNRAVWRKEDFDKMVAAGNFTIVSKQPWGYEVKVKSGNIYGVEIKDTYTKGSADRKTKDVNLMFEFLIKIVKEGTGVSTSVAEKAVSKLLDAEGPISAGVDNSVIIRKAKKYLPSKDSFTYTKGSADKKTKDEETSYKGYHISKGQHETGLSGYKIDNPNGRRPLMDFYKTIGDAKEAIDKFGIYLGKDSKDKYTKGSADKKTKDQINPEYIRKRKILVDQLERAKKNRAPIETVENITDMIKKLDEDYDRGSAKDKYTGDPLTSKGKKIMAAMREKYGKKKGTSVFYASKNKGTISGVDGKTRDYRQPKTVKYKGFEIDPYFGQFSDGDIGDETYLIYKNNKLVVSKEFYTVEEAKAYIDKKYK